MPRTTYVKKAQKNRTCYACGDDIEVGQPYKWFKIKQQYGGIRRDFHEHCRIRASMMTTSPYRGGILSAQEAVEDALVGQIDAPADAAQVVRDYAEAIREVGQQYEESGQNIEDGFEHETYQSQELKEKGEACEYFAEERDGMADEIEELPDPEADESDFLDDYDGETDEDGQPVDQEEWAEFLTAQREERRDALIAAIEEATQEEPEI